MNDDRRIILHICESPFAAILYRLTVKHFPESRDLPCLDTFLPLPEALDLCPSLSTIHEFRACRFAEDMYECGF